MVQSMDAGPGAFWAGRVEPSAGRGPARVARPRAAQRAVSVKRCSTVAAEPRRVRRGTTVAAATPRAAAARQPRVRAVKRTLLRRVGRVLAVGIVLWSAGVAGTHLWRGVSGVSTPEAPVVVSLTVQPGDSLWSLARRYGDPKVYVLDRVDMLARANRLSAGSSLVPGQTVRVPVTHPVEVARLRQQVASGKAE